MTDAMCAIAASGTVASHAPHRAAARLGHSVTVNYRKENGHD